jgi:hypothetical protein
MPEIAPVLEQHFTVLFSGATAWVLLWITVSIVYRKWKGKPLFADRPSDARFLEAWTSGHSNKSALTKIGGARNCLLVAVTPTALIVRPHFPFSLLFLPEVYDLEYVIPRAQIRAITPKRSWFGETVEIQFALPSGAVRSIELKLRQQEQFLRVAAP